MGGDEVCVLLFSERYVSIHAPAWGATERRRASCHSNGFQSTPPHGGRRNAAEKLEGLISFNPRPRMGGDPDVALFAGALLSFNPRPRMGGDARLRSAIALVSLVSIHAPAWGATVPF